MSGSMMMSSSNMSSKLGACSDPSPLAGAPPADAPEVLATLENVPAGALVDAPDVAGVLVDGPDMAGALADVPAGAPVDMETAPENLPTGVNAPDIIAALASASTGAPAGAPDAATGAPVLGPAAATDGEALAAAPVMADASTPASAPSGDATGPDVLADVEVSLDDVVVSGAVLAEDSPVIWEDSLMLPVASARASPVDITIGSELKYLINFYKITLFYFTVYVGDQPIATEEGYWVSDVQSDCGNYARK